MLCRARDAVAGGLIQLGLTPNHITVLGFLLTLAAAVALIRGAGHGLPWQAPPGWPTSGWPLVAAAFLLLAGMCDMLDGAVARLGDLRTHFGAVLDSTLDRFSDAAIFSAIALHYAAAGNLTWVALTLLAMTNALLISYIKARAEAIIESCSVGFWLRGERVAFLLIATAIGHVPAAVLLIAGPGLLTVLRRLLYARVALRALEHNAPLPAPGPAPGWIGRLQLWRYPRGSLAYDVVIATCVLWLLVAPYLAPQLFLADPLRSVLGIRAG